MRVEQAETDAGHQAATRKPERENREPRRANQLLKVDSPREAFKAELGTWRGLGDLEMATARADPDGHHAPGNQLTKPGP